MQARGFLNAAILASSYALEGVHASACFNNTPCDGNFTTSAFPGPWEAGIHAPKTRVVSPESVVGLDLTRTPYDPVKKPLVLVGNGSQVVLDFGIEVAGLVTLQYSVTGAAATGNTTSALGLAFTESSNYIGQWSDYSNGGFKVQDGALYADLADGTKQTYTMPDAVLRGGFRYMTLFLNTLADSNATLTLTIHDISLDLSIQPTWPNLRAYQGYFHSNDKLFNRLWYAGAYTLQTNAIPSTTGRNVPFVASAPTAGGWPAAGWLNHGIVGVGTSVLVDGAKRDRAVWPGDMGIAAPSIFVSTGDAESIKNALQTIYNYQNADGSFPEAGPPLLQQGSDTYHMWTMIGTYTYVLYTGDTGFLVQNWDGYLRAMAYITAKIDPSTQLLNVTGTRDWGRVNTTGFVTEAQAILFRTLSTGASLTAWLPSANDTSSLAANWTAAASILRKATFKYCYDSQRGLFRDTGVPTTTPVYPQDANSLAVVFGLVDDAIVAANITSNLQAHWVTVGSYGPYPVAPELPGTVSLFQSSWELQAHFLTAPDRALTLLKSVWGEYLDRADGTQSTFVEGMYLAPNSTTPPEYDYRWNRGYGGTGNDTATAAKYTSHAHGWSTGPTSALTELLLGLSITDGVKGKWQLYPHFPTGGPSNVRGGFRGPHGKLYEAAWTRNAKTGSQNLAVDTPVGTKGVVVLSLSSGLSSSVKIVVDGKAIPSKTLKVVNNKVSLDLEGGAHSIQVTQG